MTEDKDVASMLSIEFPMLSKRKQKGNSGTRRQEGKKNEMKVSVMPTIYQACVWGL